MTEIRTSARIRRAAAASIAAGVSVIAAAAGVGVTAEPAAAQTDRRVSVYRLGSTAEGSVAKFEFRLSSPSPSGVTVRWVATVGEHSCTGSAAPTPTPALSGATSGTVTFPAASSSLNSAAHLPTVTRQVVSLSTVDNSKMCVYGPGRLVTVKITSVEGARTATATELANEYYEGQCGRPEARTWIFDDERAKSSPNINEWFFTSSRGCVDEGSALHVQFVPLRPLPQPVQLTYHLDKDYGVSNITPNVDADSTVRSLTMPTGQATPVSTQIQTYREACGSPAAAQDRPAEVGLIENRAAGANASWSPDFTIHDRGCS